MPAAKQYEVRVAFDRVDPRTGDSKRYEPGDVYLGAGTDLYLGGVDDQGPLIVEMNGDASPDSRSSANVPATKED